MPLQQSPGQQQGEPSPPQAGFGELDREQTLSGGGIPGIGARSFGGSSEQAWARPAMPTSTMATNRVLMRFVVLLDVVALAVQSATSPTKTNRGCFLWRSARCSRSQSHCSKAMVFHHPLIRIQALQQDGSA
jgi:hypothetical protein